MEKNSNQKMVRAKEAATYLGIGESTFWRWVAQGKLPQGIKFGTRCTVWRLEVLDSFIEQHEKVAI